MKAGVTRSTRSRNVGGLALAGLGAALLVGPGACGSATTSVEAGALLLRVTVPPGGANKPEHLQLWTYDAGGLIFGGVRVPETGSLPAPASDGSLGTILIQPGTISGALRLHVRAFAGGARILDGVANVTAAVLRAGKLDLALTAVSPNDGDGDDVPDAIDDCPSRANPAQGGCGADAGADGANADGGDAGDSADAGTDGAGTDRAGTGGVAGGAGATATGGNAGRSGSGGSSAGGAGGAGTGGMGTGGMGVGGARTGGMGTGGMGTGGARTGGMGTGGVGTGGARTGGMGTGGAPKVLGVTCTGMNECASGFCVDGVCCESTCTTACRTCTTGRCLEVRRADDVPQCAGTMTCNNSARCGPE